MAVIITKEYLDALPEETIFMIRDYIWNRFGKNPGSVKTASKRESKASRESALRRTR